MKFTFELTEIDRLDFLLIFVMYVVRVCVCVCSLFDEQHDLQFQVFNFENLLIDCCAIERHSFCQHIQGISYTFCEEKPKQKMVM